jgi:hypothetical protein
MDQGLSNYVYKIDNLQFDTAEEAYLYANEHIYINPSAKESIIKEIEQGTEVTVYYGFQSITIQVEVQS